MAIVPLTVQEVVPAGINLTDQGSLSTSDTYTFPNDGKTALHFKKAAAVDCVVTIATPNTDADGNVIAEKTVTVPASTGDVMIGPLKRSVYNNDDGLVSFTLSNVASLTVALFRLDD